MADEQLHVPIQPVEYLAVSEGLLGHPTTGQPVVIVTIRPDPPSFLVVNLALPLDQAWRLARDIENLLVPFVLLLGILLTTGCGLRADVESAKWASSSGERERASVQIDLLGSQRSEPVAETRATEPPPKPVAVEKEPVIGSGNTTVIVNVRGGDTHYETHTHFHINQTPQPRAEERRIVTQEMRNEPRRPMDGRCEQMAREHQRRVEMWQKFPLGR